MSATKFIDDVIASWSSFGPRSAVEQGDNTLTYDQLSELTSAVSGELRRRGARRVGLFDRGDVLTRAYYFSIARAGSTIVPLSVDWPLSRLDDVLGEAQVDVILDSYAERQLEGWRSVPETVAGGTIVERPTSSPGTILSSADIGYILFTSGSTGRPKGVPVKWSSVEAFCTSVIDIHGLTSEDRISATFGLTFDVSVFDIFAPAIVGATSVLPRSRGQLACSRDYVNDERLSVWFSVPGRIDLANRLDELTEASLPTLRQSMFIGEQLSSRQARDWGIAASRSEVHNLYGPTEAAVACLSHRVTRDGGTDGAVPIGKPYPGVSVRIGSYRHDRELLLSGPQVFEGYLRTEDTANAFEERDGIRWYRTGDIVVEDSDGLRFESRLDRQVKVSGYRIELGDIEAAFLAAGVSRAHAFVEDKDDDGVAGLVVCVLGNEFTEQLQGEVRRRLPSYMWPRTIIPVTEFPLTASGKVDGAALRHGFSSVGTATP